MYISGRMVKCARVFFEHVVCIPAFISSTNYGLWVPASCKKIFKKSNTELMWSVVNDQVVNVPPNPS